jgi:hypothetical protein
MLFRSVLLASAFTLALFLVSAGAHSGEQETASQEKAREWFGKAMEKLLLSRTAEWDAAMEVVKMVPPEEQIGRKYPFQIGTMKYHFRIKGKSRVHWAETWEGKGNIPTREAWYEGFTWHLRSSDALKKLARIEIMEGEGTWAKSRISIGGVFCWRLPHLFDAENPKDSAFAYVELFGSEFVHEDKLNDRPVVVLDLKLGFGAAGHSAPEAAGTSRVWIDREKFLLLKRETTLGSEVKKLVIEVRETYSNWKLDQPIPNDAFHIDGMGPPDVLVDAPEDPDAFESEQTKKFLGFAVQDFPKPQGTTGFDDLPKDAPALAFTLAPRKPPAGKLDPAPRSGHSATATGPDGTVIEAYCGHGYDKTLAPGHKFKATRENRRHDHGGGTYFAPDIFVGKRTDGKLQSSLFFRDVGHDANLHDVALDGKSRCHLLVCDHEYSRFKLLWMIGDLSTGKWAEAWCVDHRKGFLDCGRPRAVAWKDTVHLLWNWHRRFDAKEDDPGGVFHVAWTPAGFGAKTRLHRGESRGIDVAADPGTGRLVVVFTSDKGAFVTSRSAKGPWTRPAPLPKELAEARDLEVRFEGEEGFVIRANGDEPREWLLQVK